MKFNLKFLILCIVIKLNKVNGDFNYGFSSSQSNQIEEQNLALRVENSELKVNISNLELKAVKLESDLFNVRKTLKICEEGNQVLNTKCNNFEDHIQNISENLKNISIKFEPIKQQFENISGNALPESNLPQSCADATITRSGVYKIAIPYSKLGAFDVACDIDTQDGNWTIIQRRIDGSVNFNRPWAEYKKGFGSVNGEYIVGLDKLHLMTTYKPQELLIIMEDFNNVTKYAKYNKFMIGNEREQYKLKLLGDYSGTAGDSLKDSKNKIFSTFDNDQTLSFCSTEKQSGYWYDNCSESNLNGVYLIGEFKADWSFGIVWKTFNGNFYYSLKSVKMMIRPKKEYSY